MGAALWSGVQACIGHVEVEVEQATHIVPDTGSTSYDPPTLPLLELTEEVCEALDTWITTQAGNGDPGEGSPDWEEFIHQLAELYPQAVIPESESEQE